jgi:hypothetical protein
MAGCIGMSMSMLVLGRVATTNLAASHAHPEMYPPIAEGYALLTASGVRLDVTDYQVEVIAKLMHICP